jgi:cytochrome c553
MNVSKFAHLATCAAALLGLAVAPAYALDIKLPQETSQLKASTLAGHQSASAWCVMCHSVTKMVKVYGAPIPEDQVKLISEYLGTAYGNDSK